MYGFPILYLDGDFAEACCRQQVMDALSAADGLAGVNPVYGTVFDDYPQFVVAALAKHREFVMASGEMSSDQFTGFLRESMHAMCKVSQDGAIHYICMDYRHLKELLDAAIPLYGELKQLCVWNKDNAGMGTFYRSKHELVAVFKHGQGKHINNFGLGDNGRYRSNVWDYPGANSIKNGSSRKDLEDHPTPKCVAMVADAIRDCSKRGGIIF